MKDSKKAFLESLKISRSVDQAIAGQLTSNLDLARTYAFVAEQETRIENLKAEDVREAFQKFVDPKKLVIIRAGDFK
jgi:zinc protease